MLKNESNLHYQKKFLTHQDSHYRYNKDSNNNK